ncbi:MAG: hypothetical protein O3B13_22285 [Planctomycetota bacterium]|nr:hypothetical protein [Planctomycetota bacterium]MDA1165837.1 hypothetical protein [Planctomycetota bacterium]
MSASGVSRRFYSSLSAALPFAATLLLLFVTGCGGGGDDGPPRFRVSGTVTFDGKPVPAGTIYFQPAAGNKGPAGLAAIVKGKFDTSSGKGTVGGPHNVRVEGTDAAGVPIFVPHFEEIDLPKESSRQEFEIPASAADNLQTDAEPV